MWLNRLSGLIMVAVAIFMDVQASANSARKDRTCEGFERVETFLSSLDQDTEVIVCNTTDIRGQLDGRVLEGFASLRRIQIKGTRVSGSIPEEVASLVRLETLDLSNNILTGEVPSKLANLQSLREVDLRGNDHLTMPTFLRNVAERSTKLQVLRIDSKPCDGLYARLRPTCREFVNSVPPESSRKLTLDDSSVVIIATSATFLGVFALMMCAIYVSVYGWKC